MRKVLFWSSVGTLVGLILLTAVVFFLVLPVDMQGSFNQVNSTKTLFIYRVPGTSQNIFAYSKAKANVIVRVFPRQAKAKILFCNEYDLNQSIGFTELSFLLVRFSLSGNITIVGNKAEELYEKLVSKAFYIKEFSETFSIEMPLDKPIYIIVYVESSTPIKVYFSSEVLAKIDLSVFSTAMLKSALLVIITAVLAFGGELWLKVFSKST